MKDPVEALVKAAQAVLDSEDNTGCSEDLTVVSSAPIASLREVLKEWWNQG